MFGLSTESVKNSTVLEFLQLKGFIMRDEVGQKLPYIVPNLTETIRRLAKIGRP